MPSWNSEQYLKFERERTQPAVDLASRVALDRPRRVIDLGCGPGNSTAGFTRLWPSVGVGLAMAASLGLLALAARGLPIGTAYAVWTGIGAAGTTVAGIFIFNESASAARLVCLTLIVVGVVGLKAFGR